MGKTITTRLPDKFVLEIKEVAERENVDTSTAVRKLLAAAIKEWKKQKALEALRAHKISLGKAAEECEISIWEMIELAKQEKIDWVGYTEEDLERDLEIIKRIK